jgi:hypothetical protein
MGTGGSLILLKKNVKKPKHPPVLSKIQKYTLNTA